MYKLLDLHRRHYDQIAPNRDNSNEMTNTDRTDIVVPTSEHIHSEVIDNNSEFITVTTREQELEGQGIRRLERLRSKLRIDYRQPHLHSSCGGCGE